MNIEKIVLDVLEKYKTVDKENFDADRFVFIRYKIDNCDFKDIAKSIVAKIQAVSIDRDELEKILTKMVRRAIHVALGESKYGNETVEKYTDKILSLLKPVSIDREIIIKETRREFFGNNEIDGYDKERLEDFADKILSLLKPVKTPNEEEVQEIFDRVRQRKRNRKEISKWNIKLQLT